MSEQTHGGPKSPPSPPGSEMDMSGVAHMPQVPLQHVCPPVHAGPEPHMHVPLLQVSPPCIAQLLAHAPQWRRSVIKLAQPSMPQQLCPRPQASAPAPPGAGQPQLPEKQTSSRPQTRPHSPQFFGSAEISTQTLPQHLPPH
jgi:hypothetical protein